MSDCAIFRAARLIELVWREIEHLRQSVEDSLHRHDLAVEYLTEVAGPQGNLGASYAFSYRLFGAFERQRNPAQLLLGFDLARQGPSSSWPPCQAALLLLGYVPKFTGGWEFDGLAFDTSGQFVNEDVRAELRPSAQSGGRLLCGDYSGEGLAWNRRSWMFAVELGKLDGPGAAEHEVVAPIIALLSNPPLLDSVFESRNTVIWPEVAHSTG